MVVTEESGGNWYVPGPRSGRFFLCSGRLYGDVVDILVPRIFPSSSSLLRFLRNLDYKFFFDSTMMGRTSACDHSDLAFMATYEDDFFFFGFFSEASVSDLRCIYFGGHDKGTR